MINAFFSEDYLKDYYLNNIKGKSNTAGLDKVTNKVFESQIFSNINTICKKVTEGTYSFTRYKGFLMPKRPDKNPRAIVISTIRDKLVLSTIKEILLWCYNYPKPELVQTKIDRIKSDMKENNFDAFLKIDIKDYFPSISHPKLLNKLESDGVEQKIVTLIKRAIAQEIDFNGYIYRYHKTENKGIPQGLPISNIIAEIYLSEFDQKYISSTSCKYYRYVDDILILYNSNQIQDLYADVSTALRELLDLYVHDLNSGKTFQGKINEGFEFLGYKYNGLEFTVRESTVQKLEKSIETIFAKHNRRSFRNMELFLWELNNRITGVIVESKKTNEDGTRVKKKYGWLFFFSQMDDKNILYHLDSFVQKLLDRYKVRSKLNNDKVVKRFVRSYHEIKFNRFSTKYIPNYARFTPDKKRELLNDVFKKKDIDQMGDDDVDRQFYYIIYRAIKDLEEDVQDFS